MTVQCTVSIFAKIDRRALFANTVIRTGLDIGQTLNADITVRHPECQLSNKALATAKTAARLAAFAQSLAKAKLPIHVRGPC